MTNEEAIIELKQDKDLYETENCHSGDGTPDGNLMLAIDLAISALRVQDKEPCEYCKVLTPDMTVMIRIAG